MISHASSEYPLQFYPDREGGGSSFDFVWPVLLPATDIHQRLWRSQLPSLLPKILMSPFRTFDCLAFVPHQVAHHS
ncbi:hypothetical protein KC347_g312 [Hortaea werneckii]|nr:hypothetical protein KC347_g312 [Hortaea werneckii]